MTRALFAFLCLPAVSLAQDWDVSYDYIGIGYSQVDQQMLGFSVDVDGYHLEASGGGDHVHAFAAHSRHKDGNVLGLGADLDIEQNLAGIGLHFSVQPGELLIQPAISVYVELAYARANASVGPVAGVDEGTMLSTGVRIMPRSNVEFRAGVTRYEGDLRMWESGFVVLAGETSSTSLALGGTFHLSGAAAVELGYARNRDVDADTLSLGLSFYFDD